MSDKAKYGMCKNSGEACFTGKLPVTASTVFSAKSGRFVYQSATVGTSALLVIADSGTMVDGAVEFVGTASSTSGATKLPIQTSCEVWYELPIRTSAATALTEAKLNSYIGKTCDLLISANVQYADLSESSEDVIQIMGYDYADGVYANQTVFVKMNPAKIGQTGVA